MIGALLSALFLGIIEGLTEFLPVSSTGHLLVLAEMIDFKGSPGHSFEIFIQLGAILAVIILYRRKLWTLASTCKHDSKSRHFILALILGTIPALIVGALGHGYIKENFYTPTVIAYALIIGGIVMIVIEKVIRPKPELSVMDELPLKTAFIIGCCQTIALIPGVSRSGASIMGGLSLGLSRRAAAEFSFFLAIPVMIAAVTYDTYKNWEGLWDGGYMPLLLTGFIGAFLTALIVIKFALAVIARFGFFYFGCYRIIIGILILCFFI